MKDSVLRTYTTLKENGTEQEQIVDTYEDGDCYVLVLVWAQIPGKVGELPRKTIHVKKEAFSVPNGPNAPYELLLPYVVDIDALTFDESGIINDADWSNPDNLFTPAPKDEDTMW